MAPFGIRNAKPFIDPSFGDPEAQRLRTALQKNDWKPADDALAQTSDLTRYEFLVMAISDFPGRPGWVRKV